MDYFGNDPRGVTEHTQRQIDARDSLEQDIKHMKSALRVQIGNLEKKHGYDADTYSVEAAMQYIDDAFYKALNDLETRIGS